MHIDIQDKKFKWIYWAQIFLVLGFFASPTVVALYHILIFIPAILTFKILYKNLKVSRSSVVLISILTWALISNFYNFDTIINYNKSFQELKFYFFGWFLIYPLYYFYERASNDQIQRLLKTISYIVIAAFFVGIIKSWFKFDLIKFKYDPMFHNRSGGFLGYMRYGYGSGFLFLLGLSLYFNKEKLGSFLKSKVILSSIFFCLFAVATSQTRGALLGLIFGVPFLLIRYKPMISKILLGLGAIFFTIVVIVTLNKSSNSRYLNVYQGSNNVRLSQFLTAVKVIQEKPILGLGSDQFSYNVKKYKEKYDIWAKNFESHAHNIFLEHGASFGVPGIILLLLFFIFWFVEMFALKDAFGWGICSYIIAFCASGQVENLFDNSNSHLLFYIYSISQVYKLRGGLLNKTLG